MNLFSKIIILMLWTVSNIVFAGSVFITGHDPIWHSNFGNNSSGAINIATTGIEYVRNGSTDKFLFIESSTSTVPSGNAYTAPFLQTKLGYSSSDYDVMDGNALTSLSNFRTTLDSYSAIVIASDHGGMLTSSELNYLNSHSNDIIDYINSGGGVYAEAESNVKGLIGSNEPFGFLPFVIASTAFQVAETSNMVTPFGQSLDLIDGDFNGNFSHNYFASTGGMTAVDFYNGDPNRPLTLAFTGSFTPTGVVPIPAAVWMFGSGLIGLWIKKKTIK